MCPTRSRKPPGRGRQPPGSGEEGSAVASRRRFRLQGSVRQARRLPPDWPAKVFDAHIDQLIRAEWDILVALEQYDAPSPSPCADSGSEFRRSKWSRNRDSSDPSQGR